MAAEVHSVLMQACGLVLSTHAGRGKLLKGTRAKHLQCGNHLVSCIPHIAAAAVAAAAVALAACLAGLGHRIRLAAAAGSRSPLQRQKASVRQRNLACTLIII
jgi:hypothetical protein